MRCGRVERLIERYADGRLEGAAAEAVAAHLCSCARCARRAEAARLLVDSLAGEPAVKAPDGFKDAVMNAVYKEARKLRLVEALHGTGKSRPPATGPAYRRLGLSFLLAAAVLAASLFIPRAAYPTLMGPLNAATGQEGGTPSLVKNLLDGAGSAVRGALGSPADRVSFDGGTTR